MQPLAQGPLPGEPPASADALRFRGSSGFPPVLPHAGTGGSACRGRATIARREHVTARDAGPLRPARRPVTISRQSQISRTVQPTSTPALVHAAVATTRRPAVDHPGSRDLAAPDPSPPTGPPFPAGPHDSVTITSMYPRQPFHVVPFMRLVNCTRYGPQEKHARPRPLGLPINATRDRRPFMARGQVGGADLNHAAAATRDSRGARKRHPDDQPRTAVPIQPGRPALRPDLPTSSPSAANRPVQLPASP